MDFPNPYQVPSSSPSPGERYQRYATEAAELAGLFGLKLTPRGIEALSILIQEAGDWFRDSGGTMQLNGIASIAFAMVKRKIQGRS